MATLTGSVQNVWALPQAMKWYLSRFFLQNMYSRCINWRFEVKLLEKLSEITQFSRFFPSSNSVFDLRSSSSTTVYSISLSSTLIFVCFHMAQPLTIQLTDDVPNSLDWLKFLLDEDTKTKPIHAPSPSFVSRILNYSLVCSCHSPRWKHKDEADSRALFRLSRIRIRYYNLVCRC